MACWKIAVPWLIGEKIPLPRACYALCIINPTQRLSSKITKARKYKPANVSGNRSSSRARRRQRTAWPKPRSTTPRRGSSTRPFWASDHFTTSSESPWVAASCAGDAPVDPGSTKGPLRSVGGHEGHIRSHAGPCVILDIAGVRLCVPHPQGSIGTQKA